MSCTQTPLLVGSKSVKHEEERMTQLPDERLFHVVDEAVIAAAQLVEMP